MTPSLDETVEPGVRNRVLIAFHRKFLTFPSHLRYLILYPRSFNCTLVPPATDATMTPSFYPCKVGERITLPFDPRVVKGD